ncbi:MAG: 3-hydroxyacyl-CoA dehydrogenase family protein [Spirochaetes bacterium]|jgi:3-hydroxybutyryl-CoA dehydrogenase|nr:3-hydroxyacyl-CoA dehydrogenase family protein [Spirochaetota bacterium]
MTAKIKTVAIVGAGFMGCQIASRVLVNGYTVKMYDTSGEKLEEAKKTTSFCVDTHFMKPDAPGSADEVKGRVTFHDRIDEAVVGADLVIEAVVEEAAVKKAVFAEIEKHANAHAVIATNSSSIPVSRIETGIADKSRVLNMHFTSPIDQLYYVELMKGTETADETIKTASDFLVSIDCLPLVCKKESIGFVFNRVWHAARRDALNAWAGGYVDYRDVDRAWMLFSKMPLGPFGIMDFIGLDVVWQVQMTYYEETGDGHYRPPRALKEMVERGDLGRKTGRGFYDWSDPEFARPDFLRPKR